MNISKASSALRDLQESIKTGNTILINVYIKRLSSVVDNLDTSDSADNIFKSAEQKILIAVGLKLKRFYDELNAEEVTLATVYDFINRLHISAKYDNLKDLKKSARKAWNATSYPLMQLAVARALNLSVSKRPQKRSKITQEGFYMGSTGKGFKTERGAKSARTKYLKKNGLAVHHGEYDIVQVGDVFAIQLP